jgi:RimJ/RimL family protein N-acetyltransferase
VTSDQRPGVLSSYAFPDELHAGELVIRPPRADDLERIAPAFLDPAVGGEAGLPPFDLDMLRRLFNTQLPEMRASGLLSPYVIDEGGKLLGGAALHHLDRTRDVLELGYWLFVEARGRGVATRVVEAFCAHAFAHGIFRVEAVVRVGNTASERVLERAGFTREGVKRGLLRHEGERVDSTLFARIASDG